jgi:hypothetical protein
VSEQQQKGHDTAAAKALLESFERSLSVSEADLDRLTQGR